MTTPGITAIGDDEPDDGDVAPLVHPQAGCITCADEGIEMRVISVDAATNLAVCADETEATSEVDLGIVAGVKPGDEVLVHAGVALGRAGNEVAGGGETSGAEDDLAEEGDVAGADDVPGVRDVREEGDAGGEQGPRG